MTTIALFNTFAAEMHVLCSSCTRVLEVGEVVLHQTKCIVLCSGKRYTGKAFYVSATI